jgi:hypothetical protein
MVHLPFAAAVAEFGLLLRDPAPLAPRWQALASRLKAVSGGGPAADREAFDELVAMAATAFATPRRPSTR